MQNLSLIKRRHSLLAAWLGLLAVMLLFVAPVISKSLAVSPAWHSMMMPGMAMHEEMAMGSAGAEHRHDAAADQSAMPVYGKHHPPLSMMDDSACGYCVLLAHLPLDLARLPPLWSALQAARLPAPPLLSPVIARIVPRYFHPRAPPRR